MTRWRVFYESWQFECCGKPFAVGDTVRWPLVLEVRAEGASTVEGRIEEGSAPAPEDIGDFVQIEEDGEGAEGEEDGEDGEGAEGEEDGEDEEGVESPEDALAELAAEIVEGLDDDDDDDDDDGPPVHLVTAYGVVDLSRQAPTRPEPGPAVVRLRGDLLVGGHGTGGGAPLPLRVHRLWVRCEPEVPDGEGRLMPDPAEPPYTREVAASPQTFAHPEALHESPDDAETTGGIVCTRTTGHLPGVRETGILAEVEPVPPPGP